MGDETNVSNLLDHVMPPCHKQVAKCIFTVLCNVKNFLDIINCVNFIDPEHMIDLFPAKELFVKHIDHAIIFVFLLQLIQETEAVKSSLLGLLSIRTS